MKYAAVIEPTESGYSAYIPDLPGCIATGETREAVHRNIQEAAAFHLDGMREDGLPYPASGKPSGVCRDSGCVKPSGEAINAAQIMSIARSSLAACEDRSGSILYSSHETLTKGPVYLMGLNPGGDDGPLIRDSIDSLLTGTGNAYLDEVWASGNCTYGKGGAPLQRRVAWLLGGLKLAPEKVCASNLIFLRSRDDSGINYPADADLCWPIHDAILQIVQPKLIIAFGNSKVSPYQYLWDEFHGTQDDRCPEAGHGRYLIKGFRCTIQGRPTYVAGLPHMSRYDPNTKPHVLEWLQNKLLADE